MKPRHIRFQVIAFLLSAGTLIQAQPPRLVYQDIGDPYDYTSLDTRCVFQDSLGLVWIGTSRGLDRWDGNRLHCYPYVPFDSTSIPFPDITSITEDDRNNLWLGTGFSNYLIRFNKETEQFNLIKLYSDSLYYHYTQVKYDPEGFLWVGCRDGLYRYYPDEDSLFFIQVAEPDYQKERYDLGSIDFDTAGGVWVTDFYMHLYYLDRENDLLLPQHSFDSVLLFNFAHAYKMRIDQEGHLWMLGSYAEIYKINPYEKSIEMVKPPEQFASSATDGGIVIDQEGNIWFGMANGIKHLNPKTGLITSPETSGDPNIISDILLDRNGNIIVATEQGVKLINSRASSIRIHSAFKNTMQLEGLWINNIIRERHIYWIGTFDRGLIRYDASIKDFTNYRMGNLPGDLKGDYLTSIFKDYDNRIWVLSGLFHLQRYEPMTDKFYYVPLRVSPFITDDYKGYLWYCWDTHLTRFDPITMDTVNFTFKKPITILRSIMDFFACEMDKSGIFWLGGDYGVYRIDPNSGEWSKYCFNGDDPTSLPNNEVSCIYADSRNRIWVGTSLGLYLIHWNAESHDFTYHDIKEGKGDLGQIYEIIEDSRGNIWVSTQFGISIIDPEDRITHLTARDGLPEYPSKIRALNMDQHGFIYAGTYEIAEIPTTFLKSNEIEPPILITEFSIDNERVKPDLESPLEKSIIFTDRIDLAHDQNFIRFDFTALNYDNPERNQYKYILEGIDRDTVKAGTRSYASYTDLAPGRYRFWVTGSNNMGFWNAAGTSVLIHIHPPWYRSGMALSIYILLVLLLIYGYIRLRTFRLQKEKILLENEVKHRTDEIRQKNEQIIEIDSIKTRFFTNISHEFRTLITLIINPLDDLHEEKVIQQKSREKIDLIRRNARKLMKLVNQLLDISKIDRGNMSIKLIESDIFDFVRNVSASFYSLAESKRITYRLDLPEEESLQWFDPDKLEKILNNLLSNAFKFTSEGGEVVVKMRVLPGLDGSDAKLELTVSDNGSGISIEEQQKIFDRFYQAEAHIKEEGGGTGIGLALTHDLVQLMHGTIRVLSEQGMGSTFIVQIPLGMNHLEESEYTLAGNVEEIKKEKFDTLDLSQTGTREKEDHIWTGSGSSDRPVILLVEDHTEIRSMLIGHLEAEYRIMEAVDGNTGLKLAFDRVPELVITDLMMPRMNGLEMCKHLKSDIRTSHIPVIMLTARASLEDKLKGLETGADAYIPKPFDIKEVKIHIRNLIQQRRKLKEKFSSGSIPDPVDLPVSSMDQRFLQHVLSIVTAHISDDSFNVTSLSEKMNLSRSTIFRKLNVLTGYSPVGFIRAIRLQHAATLLRQDYGNVTEVALEVGFSNPAYFSRMFRQTYKLSPVEYKRSATDNGSAQPGS